MNIRYAMKSAYLNAALVFLTALILAIHPYNSYASTAAIQLTATGSSGSNPSTAALGTTISMQATVTGSSSTVQWNVLGSGTINSSGVYSAPQAMPSDTSSVTIIASLASDPTVTATYQISLINPVPRIAMNGVKPTQLLTGSTQPVSIAGSGFVPGTLAVVNGVSVATSYTDPSHMTAYVPVAANAKGTLSLQVQNPAPGGGHGTMVSETILASAISLTAVDQDGTNTGTAELGINVAVGATVTGSTQTNVNWTLQGAGSLSSSGVYSAPVVMPSNSAVSITATLASNPAISATYQLSLINPTPAIASASQSQLPAGATTPVTLSGAGFVPGTVILVNGNPVVTAYQSSSSVLAQVSTAANASGSISIVAQNPAPGGGVSATLQLPIAVSLTVTGPGGSSSANVVLGNTLPLIATVSGSANNAVNWSVQGDGSISSSGVYSAPTTISSGPNVSAVATLATNPSISASFPISLTNPIPVLANPVPAQLPTGASTSVTFSGSGFVPGTIILVNGSPAATIFHSPSSITAQVAVAGNATDNIQAQAQNPSPGGGTSAILQVPVAAAISLTATNTDGTNTGTAQLGVDVFMTAAVSGSSQPSVIWSVQGPGSISSTGDYTPPQTISGSGSVVLTATLASNPSITSSYTLTLVNPIPRIASGGASPAQLFTGSTQSLTLAGSGFVPGTVVTVNGTPVSTSYTDYNHLVAQVPVPANGTGSLNIQVQNPAPGGGHGSVIQEPIAATTISLTATDQDGTNTGTAELGINVSMTATVSGSTNNSVTWSVIGAGSISSSGVYTAPATMPSNAAVTITATLVANPSITASYQLSLLNTAPTISTTAPTQVLKGGTTALTIGGSQFAPGVVILVNGTPVPTTYQSASSVTAQVAVASNGSGSVSIQAQNPSPGGGTSATIQVPIQKATVTISASNSDGVNTGTDPLSSTVRFTSSVTGTTSTTVTWSVQGVGSITQSGVYYPPSTITGSPVVTVTATLNYWHASTASYQFSLTNPVPAIQSSSPASLIPATTSTIIIKGSSFVPGITAFVNGNPVQTTYLNSTSAQISVALPGNASGSVSLAVQNPAPGGGTSATIKTPIAVESITLTATGSDGTNTGVVGLGNGLAIRATVSAGVSPNLTWTLQGPGSIDSSGYGTAQDGTWYAIGQSWPSSTNVTITATLVANPVITASYSFNIVQPVPLLNSVSPASLLSDQSQQIAIAGSKFTAASTVYFNGVAVPTTFINYGHLTAQVSLPDNASGTIPIQVQNAGPGGGASAVLQQPVALKTVQVTAYGGSTLNPTTLALGGELDFVDQIISGPGDPTVTWSVQGGGSISSSGVYLAPADMTGGTTVTVTAALVTNPAATGTYQFTLLYPAPQVSATSPTQVASGASSSVTLQGTGFSPATVLLVNGSPVTTTYNSPTSVSAQVTVSSGATGSVSLSAKNPSPGGGTGNTFKLAIGKAASASAQITLQPGQAIPANYLGFSHEWNGLGYFFGSSQTQPNLVYRQLIQNLTNGANYPFLIRIGGNSTDQLSSVQDVTAESELAAAMNVQFSLGLTLGGSTDPTLATAQAQAYTGAMPSNSIADFELGNEPDNYTAEGYRTGIYANTSTISGFLNDYATWGCSIFNVAPSVTFMGPSWASARMMQKMNGSFEQQQAAVNQPNNPAGCPGGQFGSTSIISQHIYGAYQDNGETYAADYLLTPAAATTGPASVASSVQVAHKNGQLFRIGEMNSIDGGGVVGISDAFSAALWATDTMFEYANVGVDGVNWHGNLNCNYCVFGFTIANTGSKNVYTLSKLSPLYYGMLLFQKAAANGAQLLPVSVQTTANIKVWATQDKIGTVHVVVLNKDESFTGNVSISLPGYDTAQMTQLLAPSYQSPNGVTLGGQTFDGSIDGNMLGTPVAQTLTPSNGVYVVPVQPTSAVLLTLTQ